MNTLRIVDNWDRLSVSTVRARVHDIHSLCPSRSPASTLISTSELVRLELMRFPCAHSSRLKSIRTQMGVHEKWFGTTESCFTACWASIFPNIAQFWPTVRLSNPHKQCLQLSPLLSKPEFSSVGLSDGKTCPCRRASQRTPLHCHSGILGNMEE